MKLLHFADAHIDMANYGRHDPETGLPLRVLDFLRSLDEIIDAALSEQVDLVIFAGDAYRDRSPAPTFQREWGKRIIRLSKAGIRTLLVVGNHDLSPALGRATAIQEFETLDIPHVSVLAKPQFLSADELGLPVQVIAIPWVSRSGLMASTDSGPGEVFTDIEERLTELIDHWLNKADPSYPVIFTAHASVQGAKFGAERTIMLGADLVLSGSLVLNPRFAYVALGHIHKAQDLNENAQPPVIYPGSIERVDFGEAQDEKYFVIADIIAGRTKVQWRKLERIRKFIDRHVTLESTVRLTVDYIREWDTLIDEPSMRRYTDSAFEFHLIKRPKIETRIRLPSDQAVSSLGSLELLELYWRASNTEGDEIGRLQQMAKEIIEEE
jgi:exonuclease SbcD